jgi:flavin reductase (DIM6/NTAB) family NADH-FMN oxidoreductase RutF
MHVVPGLKVLYFGTPVVLISTRNEDGTTNIAPMSSAWWLGQTAVLGLGGAEHTSTNLLREGECVLNLATAAQADAVDRIALTTGADVMTSSKRERGYRTEHDKFGTARLTEQPSELVAPGRVAECPIQLECTLAGHHRIERNGLDALIFEVDVLRTHVEEGLVIPGTHYVDPDVWDPLIMKFCEYYAGGENLRPSSLAVGWKMPHAGRPTEERTAAAALG